MTNRAVQAPKLCDRMLCTSRLELAIRDVIKSVPVWVLVSVGNANSHSSPTPNRPAGVVKSAMSTLLVSATGSTENGFASTTGDCPIMVAHRVPSHCARTYPDPTIMPYSAMAPLRAADGGSAAFSAANDAYRREVEG